MAPARTAPAAGASGAKPAAAADRLKLWEQQYPLPDESGQDVVQVAKAKLLYRWVDVGRGELGGRGCPGLRNMLRVAAACSWVRPLLVGGACNAVNRFQDAPLSPGQLGL